MNYLKKDLKLRITENNITSIKEAISILKNSEALCGSEEILELVERLENGLVVTNKERIADIVYDSLMKSNDEKLMKFKENKNYGYLKKEVIDTVNCLLDDYYDADNLIKGLKGIDFIPGEKYNLYNMITKINPHINFSDLLFKLD